MQLNLLPPQEKEKLLKEKINSLFFSVVLVILVGFLFFGVMFQIFNQDLNFVQKSLNQTLSQEKEKNKELSDLENRLKNLDQQLKLIDLGEKDKIFWSEVLTEIKNNIPPQCQIVNFSGTEKEIKVKGYAVSYTNIVEFKEKLEASSLLKNVNLESSGIVNPNEPESLIDFALSFNLEK